MSSVGDTVLPQLRFELNRVYDRRSEINEPFGGNTRSGISPSSRTPVVFVFTGESGEQYGYSDHFDEAGVFHYSGEGQVGDQQLTKGNLAIAQHAEDGRVLHVFKILGKGKGQQYWGEFAYINHTFRTGPDKHGNLRKIVVFRLLPVRTLEEDAVAPGGEAGDSTPALSLQEARERAFRALEPRQGAGGTAALHSMYERSKAVRDYVLMRSGGLCESCEQTAPFERRDGSLYLEAHHTTRLSDGGLDHPAHMGALCPTCHREIHYGQHGSSKNESLRARIRKLEGC